MRRSSFFLLGLAVVHMKRKVESSLVLRVASRQDWPNHVDITYAYKVNKIIEGPSRPS